MRDQGDQALSPCIAPVCRAAAPRLVKQAPPPEDAGRQKEGARPSTAPEAANVQDHGTKLLQLQLEAERAHRELEGKTRELVDLERELEESQGRRSDSILFADSGLRVWGLGALGLERELEESQGRRSDSVSRFTDHRRSR